MLMFMYECASERAYVEQEGAAAMMSAAQSSTKEAAELHRVIDSLKLLVEQYKQENESLKKAGQSTVKYMEVVSQNKKLKQQVAELMAEVDTKAAESRSEAQQVPSENLPLDTSL